MNIFDFIAANVIAAYWEVEYQNTIPYLGEALFPSKRMQGLKLEWIKGYDQLPVALMPSAFDTKPTLREREGFISQALRMPFFREAMRLGEEDRQNLLTFAAGNNAGYVQAILNRIYDDAGQLVKGALVIPELMRFELMQTGYISISSPNESGIYVNYNYDYDPNGTWRANNIITKTGTEMWGQADANPIKDLLDMKRLAAEKGRSLTRVICTQRIWNELLVWAPIALEIDNKTALSDAELTNFIERKTGLQFTIYDKIVKLWDGTEHKFMMDDRLIMIPSGTLGSTYFGTTPEEADLMAGNTDATVSVVSGGIAILTKKESLPVNMITSVSEIVLPTFENMDQVYNLVVMDPSA